MPTPISPVARLRAALHYVAETVERVEFGLATAGQRRRREVRNEVVRSLQSYLIPRLGDPDGPLTVVVFGPTGSGKSTIVNSLAGHLVSAAGALRPTTRAAVVWCHRDNEPSVLAGPLGELEDLEVVADDLQLLTRMSVIDTPDIDSYVEDHRRLTESVLAVADAVIYVTTAQRYADAVPWEILRRLSNRRVPILVVANRMSRRSRGSVGDLAGLMREEGVGGIGTGDDVAVIQEQRLRGEGRLPPAAMKRITQHLVDLAERHREVVTTTVAGAIRSDVQAALAVAGEVRSQRDEADALWEAAHLGYRQQGDEIRTHLASGDLVRAEVVGRWQRLVGVTDLAKLVLRGVGRLRDIFVPGDLVRAEETQRVEEEAREELIDLVQMRAARAVAAAVTAWELEAAGRALLSDDLRRVGAETGERSALEVDGWLAALVELVREQGKSRFRIARAASVGVNAAASLLLLGVFVQTGGLTGAEVGVVAGTAAAQQSILEHLFGGAAARRLAHEAREDLEARLQSVLEADASRFRRALESATDPLEFAAAIEAAVKQVRSAGSGLGDG